MDQVDTYGIAVQPVSNQPGVNPIVLPKQGGYSHPLLKFRGRKFFVGYAFGPHFRLPGGLRSVPKCHVEMEGAQERISSVPATCPGSSPVPNIHMYAICHITLPFDGWKPANRQKQRWSRHETQTRQIFSNLTFHQSDQNVRMYARQNARTFAR